MSWASQFANLLYPPACPLCRVPLPDSRETSPPICEPCAQGLERVGVPVCVRCGVGLPGAFDARACCQACRMHPRAFELARAPWRYGGTGQALIRQFKYHQRWRLGRWLAAHMAATAQAAVPLDEIAAVVPVPLHWAARRLRGSNPAEELAVLVAQALQKPCLPRALRRQRWTPSQTRLSWRQRQRNVRGAFTARSSLIDGGSLLLIDDVLTSGATAGACAQALKDAGARQVFVVTAARTPRFE